MSLKPRLFSVLNSSGQAMVNALIASGVVAVISATIFQTASSQNKDLRLPRIKMGQVLAETKVRTFLLSPSSYSNCGSGSGQCQLNTQLFAQTQFNGFSVLNPQFNPATGQFSAELRYEGQDVQLRPIPIQFQVPSEVLMAAQFVCPDETPVFRRFATSGEPVCEELPLSQMMCPEGQYLHSIDPLSLVVECRNFQNNFACSGADQTVGSINWVEGNLVPTCQSRAGVFAYHQMDPQQLILQQGSVAGISTGNPPPDPEPNPNPSYRYDNCTCERPGAWAPDESTVACGVAFTQNNACGSRPATGTNACPCVSNWVMNGDPATICTTDNVPYLDTNNCPAPQNPAMPITPGLMNCGVTCPAALPEGPFASMAECAAAATVKPATCAAFGSEFCASPCITDGAASTGPGAGVCSAATLDGADDTCCSNVSHCPGPATLLTCGSGGGGGPCVDTTWTADAASTVECGQPVFETSNCGTRRQMVPTVQGTLNCVVCVVGCESFEEGQPIDRASTCSGACNPDAFPGSYCGCPGGGPCVATEVSCQSASTCTNIAPGSCSNAGVWVCTECTPGPSSGCNYESFLTAYPGEIDRRGLACIKPGTYNFQRTNGSFTCDAGVLRCQ